MSLQWMKRKPKGFEGKKENVKVNNRIQKLICDLKSKRESLAAVQTGFPSSVTSFVTNTWMPSVHGGENKKRRWSSLKKGTFNAKCPSDEVRSSRDLQSEICTEPQIVGQFSANLQSGSGISKQIYMDPQSGGLFSAHPQSEGGILKQFSATEGSAGRFGNDPQFLGQYGNDPETGGEFGNVPGQSVSDSRFVRQSGNQPQCREQSDGGIESMSQFDRDPLPLQSGHEQNCEDQIVEEVSWVGDISPCSIPISESPARLCPFHKEFLVAVLLLAVALSVVLDVKKAAVGVTAIVYFVVRVLFRKQETEPKIQCFSARTCSVTIWPSICKWAINSLCRATDLLICRNVCKSDAFTSNCGVIVPRSNLAKDGCEGIQCSKLFNSDLNKKPRQRRVLVHKSCLGRGNSGDFNLEIGAKGLKYSSALGSSMLIVVLVGLLAGRFPAFVLALAWCLVVKLVQIAEQGKNIPSFHKGKKQLSYTR